MKLTVCGLFLSALLCVRAEDTFSNSARVAFKLYEDCRSDVSLSVCFKKKAITFLDRLGRMENITLGTRIKILRRIDAEYNDTVVGDKELEQNLPREIDDKEDELTYTLMDKLFKYLGSRKLEISLPKLSAEGMVREGQYDLFL